MIDEVLQSAGFKLNKTYKQTRFLKLPTSTFCVYLDDFDEDGADDLNLYRTHEYTIELYSSKANEEKESAIEKALFNLNIKFHKQARYWIEEEKLYQTIYEFTYVEDLKGE